MCRSWASASCLRRKRFSAAIAAGERRQSRKNCMASRKRGQSMLTPCPRECIMWVRLTIVVPLLCDVSLPLHLLSSLKDSVTRVDFFEQVMVVRVPHCCYEIITSDNMRYSFIY